MTVQENITRSMADRYRNAHQVLKGLFSKHAVINDIVCPTWIGNSDCFWYGRDLKGGGTEYRLVDAKAATNELAFDHQKLAQALAKASGETVEPDRLPLADLAIQPDLLRLTFKAFCKDWTYDAEVGKCTETTIVREGNATVPLSQENNEVLSPDGKWLVFAKDHNLWLRNLETDTEKALTTDGEELYVYGADSTGWGYTNGAQHLQALWSPDSKCLFTVQRDTRQVKDFPFIEHVPLDGSIRPAPVNFKISLPGDEHVETLRLLSIDIETGEQVPASYSQIPSTRNGYGFFDSNLGWWGKDSKIAYFVDVDRYYKYARVIEFNTETGACRILFEDTSETQFNLMNNGDMWPSFVPLPETDELLWYSERTGWAHFYLYDLKTGEMKNTVTKGEWLVRDLVTVVPERREVFLQRGCHQDGQNPYYRDLVRVNIDTGEMVSLASGDHDILAGAFTDMIGFMTVNRRDIKKRGTSPTGNYAVATRTRVDSLPETILLDREGNEILALETAEIVGLPEGWKFPEPVKLVAADGKTDTYGVLYYPSYFSPEHSWPVILYPYNTPDFPAAPAGSFSSGHFDGAHYFDPAALAELGFVVVIIDGRGGSYRDAAFKNSGYGNLQLPLMLEDQVAGLKQLAERYPFMDMDRVGITNSQNGGQGIVQALLDYPELFKVGVPLCLHDARLMAAPMWGDMFEGKVPQEQEYPEEKVEKLQGKLLLSMGMMDACTPPAIIFRLVEALQKANKDFDLILLPKLGHAPDPYLLRRIWDYLVQHLLGAMPPKEYALTDLYGGQDLGSQKYEG